jgi:type IV pilus assembly protein PilC
MPIFDFKAKDLKGATVTGVVETPTEAVAYDVLKERQLVVLSLKERKRIRLFQSSLKFFNRIPRRDIALFARQLAVMISATVPIVHALRILTRQTSNVNFKIIISEIADEVDGGAKLSATLARYPNIFSDFFIHMIRAGETTGKLDETLNYLADQEEKDYDLMSKIKGAMTYPIFILGALVLVGVLMMIFVIPQLSGILQESGQELPPMTKLLIGASDFLKSFWWLLLLLAVGLGIGYRYMSRTPQGKVYLDRFKMRVPIFGQIFQHIYLVRFSRSLSTLVASGIPITQSLEITADVVGNTIYKDLTLRTIQEVEGGHSISSAFNQSRDIPVMLSQMLEVGEQTGKLDMILDRLADFYARELENLVTNLVSLIEPLILLVMGGAVALLVVAILLPLYNLSSAI